MRNVGIDDLNVVGGSLVVDARTIAEARGTAHTLAKLELVSRSLPASFEDPVTLAVNAALPVVEGHRDQIGLLIVATESAFDDAKPISSYVHHWLGLPEACRHLEVKHACYGGTAALQLAADWVAARAGREALVITTDLARRLFHDSAEPAEGAGAVAMRVTANPRVLALGQVNAVAAREIYDVMRPTRTAEVIHASKSLAAYLDLLEATWDGFRDEAGQGVLGELSWMIYHTPLVALVRQAHRMIVEDPDHPSDFETLVRPSVGLGQRIGNTYSGALYVALASLALSKPVTKPTRIGLYSYGSGSCAELYDGWLQPTAHATVSRHSIAAALDARPEVDLTTYEALVLDVEKGLSQPHFEPGTHDPADHDLPKGSLVLSSVVDHYRSYAWT